MKYQHFWPQKSPPDSARLHPILKKVKKHKQSKGFLPQGHSPVSSRILKKASTLFKKASKTNGKQTFLIPEAPARLYPLFQKAFKTNEKSTFLISEASQRRFPVFKKPHKTNEKSTF